MTTIISLAEARQRAGLPPAQPDRMIPQYAPVFVEGLTLAGAGRVIGRHWDGGVLVIYEGQVTVARRDQVEPLRPLVRRERNVERATRRHGTAIAEARPDGRTWLVRFDDGSEAIAERHALRAAGWWEPTFEGLPAVTEMMDDGPEAA